MKISNTLWEYNLYIFPQFNLLSKHNFVMDFYVFTIKINFDKYKLLFVEYWYLNFKSICNCFLVIFIKS